MRLHIVSFLETRIHLEYLGLEHPVFHLIVYPDGSTNAPEPRVKQNTTKPVQRLFDLAVGRADLRNGMLLLNDREIPLDFSADDVDGSMTYDLADHRYDGALRVGKIDAKYQDLRDIPARGEMEFSLWRNEAQVKSLKLASQKSSLEAQGKLTNFDNPSVQFTYNAAVDIGELGAITRTYELRAGTLTASGSGNYSETGHSARGKLAIRGFDYLQEGATVRNANATADFSFDNNRLALTRIAGRVLGGGELTGEAAIDNLMGSASTPASQSPANNNSQTRQQRPSKSGKAGPLTATTAKISGPGPQHGTARLRVSGVPLGELIRAISTRSLPLASLKPVGTIAGTIELAWTRSLADAQGELALDVTPPAQLAEGELPVSGTLRSHYNLRQHVMNVSALNLTTPHTRLNASGTLGAIAEDLKVDFTATSLTELEPFLAALGFAPSPIELAGEANFRGTVIGRLPVPQLAGHVQASNFTYVYNALPKSPEPHPLSKKEMLAHAATTPQPEPSRLPVQVKRIHIDTFSADVNYSQTQVAIHHAVIQEGSARLNVDWTAELEKGSFTDDSPFQLQAAIHNADVSDLQRAAGFDYPVTGIVNATMEASGAEGNPHGQGQFTLTGAEAYGRPIKSLGADVEFANHEAQCNHIRLQAAGGVVAGTAAYNFVSKAVSFDLNGVSLNLAEIPELQSARLQTGGVARFEAKGSGTIDEPIINGHLQVKNLVLNGETVGGFTADAVTHGRQLQLTARSNFSKASFSLDGNVELRGDMPGNMTMQFSNLDIDPFLRAEVKGRITGHSSMAGQATLSGPLKQPRFLNGDFKINEFKVEVEKVPIASDGPIELRLANGVVSVQRCALVSEESRLVVSGSMSLQDNRRLDLRADGNINLTLVHTLDPEVTSYGAVTLGITVAGDTEKPLINGRIEIVHAGLSMIDLPAGLGDINGSFVFNQDRLEVEHLTAHMGGGLVTFAGFVTYGRTVGFDLTSTGNEIRFRYAGISVTSDQSLHLVGTLQSATLSGDVTVTRFAQIPSTDLKLASGAGRPVGDTQSKVAVEQPAPGCANPVRAGIDRTNNARQIVRRRGLAPARLSGAARAVGPHQRRRGRHQYRRHQVSPGAGRRYLYRSGAH